MAATASRSSPITLTEAAVLLAALGWGVAFVALSHFEPAAPPEPYAACAERSPGEACRAEYRSAVIEGSCGSDGRAPLFCQPRTVRSAAFPAAIAAPAELAPAEHHASR